MIRGGDQIVDVRGERGVGEFALAGAEAGEVETQHGDAVQFQTFRNAARRLVVLAAGKAVREQRHRAHRPLRPVQQRGQRLALGIREVELLGGHGCHSGFTRMSIRHAESARRAAWIDAARQANDAFGIAADFVD